MVRQIKDRLVTVYAVTYAIIILLIEEYRRHNADFYACLGYVVGLILSVIIILWEVSK